MFRFLFYFLGCSRYRPQNFDLTQFILLVLSQCQEMVLNGFELLSHFSVFAYLLCLQEICYLDQVLDAASETPTNGNSSPSEPISIDGNSPSVCVSASSPVNHQSIIVEGQRQTTFLHGEESPVRTNGHVQADESGRSKAKFELRAFQEERRPAKLFTPGEEQHVRVTRRRPSEEVNGYKIMHQLIEMQYSDT